MWECRDTFIEKSPLIAHEMRRTVAYKIAWDNTPLPLLLCTLFKRQPVFYRFVSSSHMRADFNNNNLPLQPAEIEFIN